MSWSYMYFCLYLQFLLLRRNFERVFFFWESEGSVGLSVYSNVKKKGKRFSDETEYWIVAEDILIQNCRNLVTALSVEIFKSAYPGFIKKHGFNIIDGPEKDSKFLRPLTTLLCH